MYVCMYACLYACINTHIRVRTSTCISKKMRSSTIHDVYIVRYNPYVMVSRNTETSVPVYTNPGLVIMHVFIIGVLTQILNQINHASPTKWTSFERYWAYLFHVIAIVCTLRVLWPMLSGLNRWHDVRYGWILAFHHSWNTSIQWTEAFCRMIPGDKRSCLQLLAVASIRYLIFTV